MNQGSGGIGALHVSFSLPLLPLLLVIVAIVLVFFGLWKLFLK